MKHRSRSQSRVLPLSEKREVRGSELLAGQRAPLILLFVSISLRLSQIQGQPYDEVIEARDGAMRHYRNMAAANLRETPDSASSEAKNRGLTVDTSHRDVPVTKQIGRREKMISPISPPPNAAEDPDLNIESWGGSEGESSPHPQAPSPLNQHYDRMKEAQYIELLYKGTVHNIRLNSGQRIKDIKMMAVEGDNASVRKIKEQIEAVDRLRAFVESETSGFFDVDTYLEREEKPHHLHGQHVHHNGHHGHHHLHGHHGHHGHHHNSDDPHNEKTDGESKDPGEGSKVKVNPNKIVLLDDGSMSLGGRTDCQPILRTIEDIFQVIVRKPKALPICVKMVEGVFKTVGEEMHRGGVEFNGLRAVKTLGFDLLPSKAMVSSHELRDYLHSIDTSPSQAMKVGSFWRLPSFKAANAIRHAVQSTRGNDKATDQVLIDLVRSCSAHRAEARYLDAFCRVVEVETDGSGLPFLIYCRHLLAEWQVAAPELNATKGSIVTFEMVVALCATLFRIEDREKVKNSAKRAIAKKAIGTTLASTTCYDVDEGKQIEAFFERIWDCCYHKDDTKAKEAAKGMNLERLSERLEKVEVKSHKPQMPLSPKAAGNSIASKKTMQLLDQGRRRSIVELGPMTTRSSLGGLSMKEAMQAAMSQAAIQEHHEEEHEEEEDVEAKIQKYEVDEIMLQYHVDIGTVLDVACDFHLLLCSQQNICVWR